MTSRPDSAPDLEKGGSLRHVTPSPFAVSQMRQVLHGRYLIEPGPPFQRTERSNLYSAYEAWGSNEPVVLKYMHDESFFLAEMRSRYREDKASLPARAVSNIETWHVPSVYKYFIVRFKAAELGLLIEDGQIVGVDREANPDIDGRVREGQYIARVGDQDVTEFSTLQLRQHLEDCPRPILLHIAEDVASNLYTFNFLRPEPERTSGEWPFVISSQKSSRTLRDVLENEMIWAQPEEVLRICQCVIDCIADVHAAGTVVGNLCARNFLCDCASPSYGTMEATDIRICSTRVSALDGEEFRGQISTEALSPEMLRSAVHGEKFELRKSHDIFCLGKLLFELSSGRRLFQSNAFGERSIEIGGKVSIGEVERLEKLCYWLDINDTELDFMLPGEVDQKLRSSLMCIVRACLCNDPRHRPTASALRKYNFSIEKLPAGLQVLPQMKYHIGLLHVRGDQDVVQLMVRIYASMGCASYPYPYEGSAKSISEVFNRSDLIIAYASAASSRDNNFLRTLHDMKESRVQNYIVAVECCPSRQPLQDEEILNNGESRVLYEAIQTRSVKLHSAITRDACEDLLHRACTFSSIAWAACAKPTMIRRKVVQQVARKDDAKRGQKATYCGYDIDEKVLCLDTYKSKEGIHHKWRQAIVIGGTNDSVRVHFCGWDSKWDRQVKNTARILPLRSDATLQEERKEKIVMAYSGALKKVHNAKTVVSGISKMGGSMTKILPT